MTLPSKTRIMTRAEFDALMASGEWTWRCADMDEDHADWRMVQLGPQHEEPRIFLPVPGAKAVTR